MTCGARQMTCSPRARDVWRKEHGSGKAGPRKLADMSRHMRWAAGAISAMCEQSVVMCA